MNCPCCGADAGHVRFLCEVGCPVTYRQHECSKCGFQFTYPQPTAEEIDKYYSSASYFGGSNQSAGEYQDYDSQIVYTIDFCRDWLGRIGCGRGWRLLDVGCALGRYMEMASSVFGCQCEGVEISDFARAYIAENNPGRFGLYKAIDEMPVQSRPFDVILLFDVIEHVNSPWNLLWPLFRRGCVGRDTRLLLTTPNVASRDAKGNPAGWRYRYPPAHLSFCSPQTFAYVAKKLLFDRCDVNGHSVFQEKYDCLVAIADSYAFFDGLCCEFSGSSLGGIAAGRTEDWQSFSQTSEYLEAAKVFNDAFSPQVRNANNDFFLSDLISRHFANEEQLGARLASAESRLRESQAEAVGLKAQVADKESEVAQLDARLAINEYAIRSVNKELVDSRREASACAAELAEARERCGSLEGEKAMLAAEVDSARREAASAVEVRANLERDLAAKDGRISDLEKYGVHYETMYKSLLAESERRTEELASLRISYAAAMANSRRLAAMCDDLRGRCDALFSSVLRRALKRLRRAPGAMAVYAHRKWAKFVAKAHCIGFVGAARLAAVKVLGRVLGHGR